MRRRIALALLHVASRILPAARREWLRDMRGELEFVKSDRVALSWAIGCISASFKMRVLAMLKLNGQISRPVLTLEWLTCFVPLTLLWAAALTLIVTESHVPPDLFVVAALGTLGPIALIVSFIATVSNLQVSSRRVARLLVLGFAAMALLQILNMGAQGSLHLQWLRFDFGTFLLVCLLPLCGALHLDHFARTDARAA